MQTNQSLLNEALKKLFQAIASKDGITVTFDRNCKVPHVDQYMRVTLPPPSAVAADRYWYYAMHELGHLFKELDWSFKELWEGYLNPKDQLAVHVANLIMDNLNERNFYGEYDGVDNILDEGRSGIMKEVIPKTIRNIGKIKGNPVAELLTAGIMVDSEECVDWMGSKVQAQDLSELTDLLSDMVKAVKGTGYKQRVARMLDSENPAAECASLVKDLLALIGYKPQPPEGGKGDESGEGESDGSGSDSKGNGACSACNGTGEDSEGEPCSACDGTGKCSSCGGSGDSADGEPCNDCNGKTAKAPKGRQKMGEERFESTQERAEHIGSGHDNGAEYRKAMSDYDLQQLLTAVDKKANQPPLKRSQEHRNRESGAAGYIPWDRHRVEVCELDWMHDYHRNEETAIKRALGNSTVSKQISKYLKALVSESYVYGQKSGKLHQKSLHRLVGHNAHQGQQPNIFKKRNSTMVKLDSAVTVQLDCSGSMSGSKYIIGSACCVAICDTLNSLGIPHEILGFTEHRGLTSYVFKNFSTKLTKEKLTKVMASNKVSMSQNADGESVLWAAERLMLRPEKNKLHIVLSDGMPCGSYSGDGRAYLEYVCNMLEKQSPINLVGIGICTEAVRNFYTHNVVVNNPAQLDSVLFKVLRDFLV